MYLNYTFKNYSEKGSTSLIADGAPWQKRLRTLLQHVEVGVRWRSGASPQLLPIHRYVVFGFVCFVI